MKNKYLFTSIMLAVLTAIFACSCHAYSVKAHKAQGDTFSALISNKPIAETKSVYGRISASETETKEVSVLIDDGIPAEVKEACEKYGKEYNICPELIESLAYQESRFIADVVSADGSCIGLCQVNPKWHKDRMKRLGATDLTDIDQNVHVAADYLAEIFKDHDGEPETVCQIYNGDSSWKKGHVSKFAREIVKRSAEYERIHKK